MSLHDDPVAYAIEWKNGSKGDLTFEELQDLLIETELKLEKCEQKLKRLEL